MTDKYTADEQWEAGEFEVFDTADELMEALGGAADEVSEEYPQRIWIPLHESRGLIGQWFEYQYEEDPDDQVEYIRADIAKRERTLAVETEAAVWLKGVNELLDKQATLVGQVAELVRGIAERSEEITRLSDIISAMSDKLTDAEQVRDEALVLNQGEVLWTCDGCGAHGVVPADWKWVPGWDWDEVKRDGRWYCVSCQEEKWWLAAEEEGE